MAPDATSKATAKSNHAFGVFLLLCVVLLWVISGVFTQALNKPFFVSYLNASLQSVFLIPYLFKKAPQDPALKPNLKKMVMLAIGLCPVWLTMSSSFNWSLSATSMTNNSIISTSSNLFVMIWSSILLSAPFRTLNFLGAAFSIAGSVIVTLNSGGDDAANQSMMGDAAALLSAFVGGFYTAMLKKTMPDEDKSNDMSLFFGILGLCAMIMGAPIVALLHQNGTESLSDLGAQANLSLLAANAFLTVLSNFIWAKAIVLTSPLLATVGLSVMTPLCMVVDIVFHSKSFSMQYYGGAALVVLGYLITNIQHSSENAETKPKTAKKKQ